MQWEVFHTFTHILNLFSCVYMCVFKILGFGARRIIFLVYFIMIGPLMLIINLVISKNSLAYMKKQVWIYCHSFSFGNAFIKLYCELLNRIYTLCLLWMCMHMKWWGYYVHVFLEMYILFINNGASAKA
jgi:hypothetical protein